MLHVLHSFQTQTETESGYLEQYELYSLFISLTKWTETINYSRVSTGKPASKQLSGQQIRSHQKVQKLGFPKIVIFQTTHNGEHVMLN